MEKMNTVRVHAYAKLNFTLDVTGREGGYHMLDSLVTTISLRDTVIVTKRKDRLASVRMHGKKSESIDPANNNAQKAADRFIEVFQTTGANITIHKDIPIGGGLGGSSADAAGVLRALSRLYQITDYERVKRIADEFGSDTGYLLTGGLARLRGRGERVERLGEFPTYYLLLFCPKKGVSTKECFKTFDETGKTYAPRTQRAVDEIKQGNFEWGMKLFGNDLYPSAKEILPEVEQTLFDARSFSPICANMTGSGSCVYAIFPSLELAQWAKSRYRGKARVYLAETVNMPEKKKRRNPFFLSEEERKLT